MIDMDAYTLSTSKYQQDVDVDSNKTYYAYEISYINCYNKWAANLGLATIDSDGTVTLKSGTVKVQLNININKNPYFGLKKREI